MLLRDPFSGFLVAWPLLCLLLSPSSPPLPAQPEAGIQLIWDLRPSMLPSSLAAYDLRAFPQGRTSLFNLQSMNIPPFPCTKTLSSGSTSPTGSSPNSFLCFSGVFQACPTIPQHTQTPVLPILQTSPHQAACDFSPLLRLPLSTSVSHRHCPTPLSPAVRVPLLP